MATAVKEKGVPAGVLIGGGIIGTGLLLFWATRAGAHGEIPLTMGWNQVTYTGKKQSPLKAFASILDYLDYGVWYWDETMGEWFLVLAYIDEQWQTVEQTVMVPGGTYNIHVMTDCIWTF